MGERVGGESGEVGSDGMMEVEHDRVDWNRGRMGIG